MISSDDGGASFLLLSYIVESIQKGRGNDNVYRISVVFVFVLFLILCCRDCYYLFKSSFLEQVFEQRSKRRARVNRQWFTLLYPFTPPLCHSTR